MTEIPCPYQAHTGPSPIGSIFVPLAGVRYHEARARLGDPVTLVREPDNPHDRNAIRVDDVDGRALGHIPRRTAIWLAPLLDRGRIQVAGKVNEVFPKPEGARGGAEEVFLRLDLSWTDDPDWAGNTRLAILDEVRQNLAGETDPATARRLGKWLMALWRHDLEPEAKMMLAIMRNRARALEMPAEEEVPRLDPGEARKRLQAVTIGEAVRTGRVSVYPLFKQDDPAGDTILLQDAIAGELAEVSEVSEGGSVPELKVVNRSDRMVLIPEGEILVGAKQDRTVNITLMVEPHGERIIPVSCVEQGRWRRASTTFAAGSYATPGVRASKTTTVNENIRRTGTAHSDQTGVWEDVARYVAESGAESDTGSLSHAFDASRKRLKKLHKALTLPAGAAGVLVTVGDEVLGLDLFDDPDTMKAIWPRLAEGYFLEVVLRQDKAAAAAQEAGNQAQESEAETDADEQAAGSDHAAAVFMEKVAQHLEFMASATLGSPAGASAAQAGPGWPLEVTGPGLTGSGLWHEGRIRHLAAFTKER